MLPDPRWNETDVAYADSLHIHELFEQQVGKTPENVALIDNEAQYTYAEINAQANQIARVLKQNGVSDESIVGCYLTRSSAVVLLILAILKAGGTYLLFDAHTPRSRLDYIIAETKPVLIIYDEQPPEFDTHLRPRVVSLSNVKQLSESQADGNLPTHLPNTSAAYIAFTSGSTGRPKGVIITHKAIVNHACAFSKLFKLSESDRIPIMAPIAFDMAIEEMIPPLVSGCTLIVSRSKFMSMDDFSREIAECAYTLLNIPAPLWLKWSEYLLANNHAIPPSIRIVIAGSEAIDTKGFLRWKNIAGSADIWWVAAYGTTETTITSTFYTTAYSDTLDSEPCVPIGKPIANTYAYILDEQLRQVPVGDEGELYIGGHGLARSYFHLDSLTKERFVPNPFRHETGSRMYKTGDLARYREDGTIVWLGRLDSQIKLDGLRIEPGDIEAVIQKSLCIKEAVVVLQRLGNRDEDKQLVAFVTIEPGQEFDEGELRQLAFHHLPNLMNPSRYVVLTELPLNVNGKIDYKALENHPAKLSPSKPQLIKAIRPV